MNQSRFSVNGYEYSFQEGSLLYKDPYGREITLFFDHNIRLKKNFLGGLRLQQKGNVVPLSPLSEEQQRTLLTTLFDRWEKRSPDLAKKSAFDYVDGQKGFSYIAITVGLFFFLPFSIALLADSKEQFTCTQELRAHAALGNMQVTKAKKKRKGHYILDLEFVTPQGVTLQGKDQIITMDETTIPKSVPVVYSPIKPQCWSLTPNLEGNEPNWAKRRYFSAFTLLFGSFFLLCAIWGTLWGVIRLTSKRPHAEEIEKLFQFH